MKAHMKFAIFFYMVAALLLMSMLTDKHMTITYDAKCYLMSAQLFRTGDYKTALDLVFPHWPPLYPVTLAIGQIITGGFIKTEKLAPVYLDGKIRMFPAIFAPLKDYLYIDIPWARLVSICGFCSLVAGVFLLGWHTAGSVAGHLSAILTLIFAPLVVMFTYASSEAVYLPLSVFSLLALFLYTQKKSTVWFIVSAFLVALAFATRHVGFILVGTGTLIVGYQNRKHLLRVFLWVAIACLPLTLWFSGFDRPWVSSASTGIVQAFEFIKVFFKDVGGIGIMLSVLGILLGVRLWWGISLYLGFCVLVLIYISWGLWVYHLDTTRFLIPIYPFLLLFISVSLQKLWESLRRRESET